MFWVKKATAMGLAMVMLVAVGICVGLSMQTGPVVGGQEKTEVKKADSMVKAISTPKPAEPIPENGVIVGRLVDAASGKPVKGATIACGAVYTDSGRAGGSNDITDADGRYRLSVPSPGIYNVWLEGYDKEPGKTVAADDGVFVEAGKVSTSVLRLQEGRKVKGKVVNFDGSPAAKVEVSCNSAARPHSGGIESVKTKDDGTFEFSLPPGRVFIYATEYVKKTDDNPFGIGNSADAHIEVSAAEVAAPIKLTLAASRSKFGGTEWLKRSTPGTQIVRRIGNQDVTGTVVDENGKVVKGAMVFQEDGKKVTTNEKGEFRVETLKGTQFVLHAYAPGHHLWFGTPTSGDVLKIVLEPKPIPEMKTSLEQEEEKETFTAWGKEMAGLQAGLGFQPGRKRPYSHDETVTLVLRVRNVSKEAVTFSYLVPFIEQSLMVTDSDGKTIPQPKLIADIGERNAGVEVLLPGKEIELYELKRKLRPARESSTTKEKRPYSLYGTGKVSIQYDHVLGPPKMGLPNWKLDPTLSKLATGKLELEIKPEPPAVQEGKTGKLGTGMLDVEVKANPPAQKTEQIDPVSGKNLDGRAEEGPLKPVRSLLGHKDRVTSVAYSPNGRWIATASWDGAARVWEAKTGKEDRLLKLPALKCDNPAVPSTRPTQILFSPDSELVVASCQPNDVNQLTVTVWKRGSGEKVHEFQGFCAAFSPEGKYFACGGWGMTNVAQCGIRIYEFPSGKLVREMTGEQAVIVSMTFSPDGQTIVSKGQMPSNASGIQPCIVSVWDVGTGKERRAGLTGALAEYFALSPDGRTLAIANEGGRNGDEVVLRESATGGQRAKLIGHTEQIFALAFSLDGRTLATASMDKTVRLWDVAVGKEVGRLEGHTDWVESVAFSPDGQMLVSCGVDQTARVWDVRGITQRLRASAERSSADLEADWKDLGSDAAKAHAAITRLVSSPESGIPFLGKRLQDSAAVDTELIEQLVAKLGNDKFQIRERATKELEAMGDRAAPTMRKALANKPSPEVNQRLEVLLSRVDSAGPSSETVREIRAVEVLEAIGGPKARQVLEKLASGPLEMRLKQEAKAAANRLAARSSIGP